MSVTENMVAKLLVSNVKFTQIAMSLLVTRYKNKYSTEPSADLVTQCTNDLNALLIKYSVIMDEDYAKIANI